MFSWFQERPRLFDQRSSALQTVFHVVAAFGARVFADKEGTGDARDGVVVDAGVAAAGGADTVVAAFDDVGGDDAAVSDFVEDGDR